MAKPTTWHVTESMLSAGSSTSGVHYVDEKRVMVVSGARVKIGSDAALGAPATFLPCPTPHGISCAAASWRRGVLAFAEKGLRPTVYVHAVPSLKRVAKLEGGADLEVCALSFARNQPWLFSLSQPPDLCLCVWDWQRAQPICRAKALTQALHLVASPADAHFAAMLTRSGITLWHVRQTYDQHVLSSVHIVPPRDAGSDDDTTLGVLGGTGADGGVGGFSAIAWGSDALLYASTALGALCCYEVPGGTELAERRGALPDGASAMISLRSHLLAAVGACVVFVELESLAICLSVQLGASVRSFALSPLCTALIAECDDGETRKLVLTHLDRVPSTADAARAAAALLASGGDSGAAGGGGGGGAADDAVSVVSIGSALTGAVHGLGVLPAFDGDGDGDNRAPPCAVTCASDGSVCVWDLGSAELLSRERLPEGTLPSALAVSRPNALVALGSDGGVLRLLRRTSAGSFALVLVAKYSTAAVSALAFDADGAYLAVAHADGVVAFVGAFKELRTLGVAISAVSARPLALAWVGGGSASARLVVSCDNRTVVRLLPPSLSAQPADDLRLTRADTRPRATKLPAVAHALAPAPPAMGANGVLAACSDGSVRLYTVAADDAKGGALVGDEVGAGVGGEADGAAAAASSPPLAGEVCAKHPTAAKAIAVSADGRHFVSASEAGVVLVSDALAPAGGGARAEWSLRAHDSLLGGVARVAILATDGQSALTLASVGCDGVMYVAELVHSDAPSRVPPAAPNELNSAPVALDDATAVDADVPERLGAAVAAVSPEESARRAAARAEGAAKLDAIRTQLDALLRRNAQAEPLERLSEHELLVDERLREQLAAEAEAEAAAFKASARRTNLGKELQWQRLRAELVEPMATRGTAIEPLQPPKVDETSTAAVLAVGGARKSVTPAGAADEAAAPAPSAVTNFPIRRPSDREARALRGIALLREVELRENAWLATERLAEESIGLAAFEEPASIGAAIGGLPGEALVDAAGAAGAAAAAKAEAQSAADEAEAEADALLGGDDADGDDADNAADADANARRRSSVALAAAAATAAASAAAAAAGGGGAAAAPAIALLAAAAGRALTTRELVYAPYEVYTERRQIAQALLSAQLSAQTKAKFNGLFDQLLAAKHKELERIAEKDARIDEICAELGEPSSAYRPTLSELEEPDRLLHVAPSEIRACKWESADERTKREAAERLALERAAAADKDDAARRALKQMMRGTLDKRKEGDLTEALVPPPFVGVKPVDDLTDAELAQLREYEALAKKAEEERDKARRALNAELGRLHAETAELCRGFNARLGALALEKLDYAQAVHEHELVLIKAAQSQMRSASAARRETELVAQLAALNARRAETAQARASFRARVDEARDAHERAEADSKLRGNEKTFRTREFADCPEYVDALWRLFRRRETVVVRADADGAGAGGAAAVGVSADPLASVNGAAGGAIERTDLTTVHGVAELDPFLPFDRAAIARREEIAPLDPGAEMPEGMSFAIWDRLERLRADKIAKEEEAAARKADLDAMEAYLAELDAEDESAEHAFTELDLQLAAFREAKDRAIWDVPIPLKLKQGQIEVEQAAVVTDMGNALFVPRAAVQLLNGDIRKLGGEKVEILKEVRDFRKGIAELVWDNERLAMEGDDLIDRTREFQLLRVTKDLQRLMKGGGEENHSAEVAQLERKLNSMVSAHEQRVAERERQLGKMRRLRAEKDAELSRLHAQIQSLEATVSERETIVHIQSSAGGDDSLDAGERVQHVHMQRKLKSLIQMQAQEIDLLREELDRLRRRTFPTFTHYEQARRQPVD